MPFHVVSSSAEAAGTISGAALSFESSIANALIPNGEIEVTVSLVPAKGLWDDYDTAPLGYTMTINNREATPFTAPITVDIGEFDFTLVEYKPGTAVSLDNTVEDVDYDATTGVLTFTLSEDILGTTGVATVTFDMQKLTTP